MAARPLNQVELTLVDSIDGLMDLRAWMGERRDWLAVDVETHGLNVGRDDLRLVQFADTERGWAVPWEDWGGAVREVTNAYRGSRIVFHNALFDLRFLKKNGIVPARHLVEDTYVMSHILDPVRSHRLKDLSVRYVDKRAKAGQDALKTLMANTGWGFADTPVRHPAYWIYGCMDTVLDARLAEVLWPRMAGYREPYEVELGFIHVMRDAELAGMAVDLDYVRRYADSLRFKMAMLEPQIPFSATSDAQLTRYLQEEAGVHLTQRTKSGKRFSMEDDVLDGLREQVPMAGLALEYRQSAWLLTNHFQKIIDLEVDGRVHPSCWVLGARTGRTSVTNPPLQTLPRGRKVRDAYTAGEGNRLVSIDYDGMEMRFMAADAGCTPLLEAFKNGQDVHKFTASLAFNKPYDEVTKPERQIAKNAGFAKIFGAGIETFARTAKVRVDEAERFMATYDHIYPEVKGWMDRLIAEVNSRRSRREWGWTETLLGRRLSVEPDEAYKAVNYRDQGSCAEIAKAAAIRMEAAGLGEFIRLMVHDEYILEAPAAIAEDVKREAELAMRDPWAFPDLPFEVDGDVLTRWGAKVWDEEPENPMFPKEQQTAEQELMAA